MDTAIDITHDTAYDGVARFLPKGGPAMATAAQITADQLERFLSPEPVDVGRIQGSLGLSISEMSAASGVSVRTVSRWRAPTERRKSPRPEASRRLRRLARLKWLLASTMGEEEGRRWLRLPNDFFHGRAPLDLLEEGNIDDVIGPLEAAAGGGLF
jgi:uncharacterized protein (DUF2384 family)